MRGTTDAPARGPPVAGKAAALGQGRPGCDRGGPPAMADLQIRSMGGRVGWAGDEPGAGAA